MSDEQFRKLCNTFGFAPSRALREMIDCVRAQEIEACAKVCDPEPSPSNEAYTVLNNKATMRRCATAIRARKEKQ